MTSVHGDFAPSEVVVLRAADRAGLEAAVVSLGRFLDQAPSAPLKDVAYTCSLLEGPAVVAIVTQSIKELRVRLELVASRLSAGAKRIWDKSGTYYEPNPVEGKVEGGELVMRIYNTDAGTIVGEHRFKPRT